MEHNKQPGAGRVPPASEPDAELAQNPAVDEFFTRLKYDMRHPKPGQEAIGAALEAIHRLAQEMDAEDSADVTDYGNGTRPRTCMACGAANPEINRFCATCGVPLHQVSSGQMETPAEMPPTQKSPSPAGQHHYHHHYHHHYFSQPGAGAEVGAESGGASHSAVVRDGSKVRATLNAPSSSRAEAAVRKLTQEWALACNSKQLDDVVSLYAADAVLLRSNLLPVRGTAAIREYFFSAIDAGFGEVEMEPLRLELFGDVAYEVGRCKMLVPVAMGKRREERGKYLIISVRQQGEWKLVADCWSSDLSLAATPEVSLSRPAPSGAGPAPRLPRKGV
ncbi:MAG: nuclear transport factor 2 family protein [Acidobacteriia bacterium]|nr:nuclear transport factor 2 family protein [Terriglobia bacterium]